MKLKKKKEKEAMGRFSAKFQERETVAEPSFLPNTNKCFFEEVKAQFI